MLLYRTVRGALAQVDNKVYSLGDVAWDTLFNSPNLAGSLRGLIDEPAGMEDELKPDELLAPIHGQEVWAAGVTYYRSRDARMEESKTAGGEDFYARVYEAERPELFFKATASRVVGAGQPVRIRRDSQMERSRTGTDACHQCAGRDHRVHGRQRHEQPRHRGRKPAVSAAGQSVRRSLRARPRHSRHERDAARRYRDPTDHTTRSRRLSFRAKRNWRS